MEAEMIDNLTFNDALDKVIEELNRNPEKFKGFHSLITSQFKSNYDMFAKSKTIYSSDILKIAIISADDIIKNLNSLRD